MWVLNMSTILAGVIRLSQVGSINKMKRKLNSKLKLYLAKTKLCL